jgi:putative nucleotidyltransferase with HDIG domain
MGRAPEEAGTVSSDIKQRLIAKVRDLPTLPAVAVRAMDLARDATCSASDVAAVVQTDAPLTSRLLRIANSAYYCPRDPITSVARAIAFLGLDTVRELILTVSVLDALAASHSGRGLDWVQHWRHSLGCAILAEELSTESDRAARSVYFVAGLLHDIGKLTLDAYHPATYVQVMEAVREGGIRPRDAEIEAYGVPHDVIGQWLAEKWGLEPNLQQAIFRHHRPIESGRATDSEIRISSTIAVCDFLCWANGLGSVPGRHIPVFSDETWEKAGISDARAMNAAADIATRVDDAARAFGITVAPRRNAGKTA